MTQLTINDEPIQVDIDSEVIDQLFQLINS